MIRRRPHGPEAEKSPDTEKGYAIRRPDGSLLPVVETDMANGPAAPRHVMSIVAALLYERYMAGALPMAVVSMDNCSHNGEKLMKSVLEIAEAWKDRVRSSELVLRLPISRTLRLVRTPLPRRA